MLRRDLVQILHGPVPTVLHTLSEEHVREDTCLALRHLLRAFQQFLHDAVDVPLELQVHLLQLELCQLVLDALLLDAQDAHGDSMLEGLGLGAEVLDHGWLGLQPKGTLGNELPASSGYQLDLSTNPSGITCHIATASGQDECHWLGWVV